MSALSLVSPQPTAHATALHQLHRKYRFYQDAPARFVDGLDLPQAQKDQLAEAYLDLASTVLKVIAAAPAKNLPEIRLKLELLHEMEDINEVLLESPSQIAPQLIAALLRDAETLSQ